MIFQNFVKRWEMFSQPGNFQERKVMVMSLYQVQVQVMSNMNMQHIFNWKPPPL